MPDKYYRSRQWKAIRKLVLTRDGHRCVVCGEPATRVDHIVPRKQGGSDRPGNLRSLCALHDNQGHREKASRGAERVERFTPRGADSDGIGARWRSQLRGTSSEPGEAEP